MRRLSSPCHPCLPLPSSSFHPPPFSPEILVPCLSHSLRKAQGSLLGSWAGGAPPPPGQEDAAELRAERSRRAAAESGLRKLASEAKAWARERAGLGQQVAALRAALAASGGLVAEASASRDSALSAAEALRLQLASLGRELSDAREATRRVEGSGFDSRNAGAALLSSRGLALGIPASASLQSRNA